MKRVIRLALSVFIVLFMVSGIVQAQEKQEGKNWLTRSYTLKYVSPKMVHQALSPYFIYSSYSNEGNIITINIYKENIPTFEKMLKELDVEKQRVLVRIFTVIASRESKQSVIGNADLQKVLVELAKVLSFKSFTLDGVSALTLTEGQADSFLLLSSHIPLTLDMGNIAIRHDGINRSVGFKFRLRQKIENASKTTETQTLIESETSVKENGYLVAGVSKIGPNGDSLVLVINVQKQ